MIIIAGTTPSSESDHKLWLKYVTDTSLRGKTILDGMMGGGTSIVESLRLGAKVVGNDINPVAWFVTKKEVEPLDLEQVEKSFYELALNVGAEIKRLYRTRCSRGHDADIMYALWHKRIDCAKCGKPINVLSESLVSERKVKLERRFRGRMRTRTKFKFVVCCPRCERIFRKDRRSKTFKRKIKCPGCGLRFNPRGGTSTRGIIRCLACKHEEKMSDTVRRNKSRLPFKMFCIEYYCDTCNVKDYKSPSASDFQIYEDASKRLHAPGSPLDFPKDEIPQSSKEVRPRNHGYDHFYQLFNDRQLLSLSMLLGAIREIKDQNVREFILLAFSACLETNNVFSSYETRWGKCGAMFSLPGYHPIDRYAENNVWGTKHGRGTFVRSYAKIVKAKAEKSQNLEQRAPITTPPMARSTQLASTFEELQTSSRNALLTCLNSESLRFIPKESVDLVATDPPYFDTLNYSRLADFFYVWLRLALKDHYDVFNPTSSARPGEVAMVGPTPDKRTDFVQALSNVFTEYCRVLKKDGPMVFTFHHTQEWAWQDLLNAVNKGGFTPVACHFVRSEGKTGFRKSGHISYDACFVCRKSNEVTHLDSLEKARSMAKDWLHRLAQSGNGLEDSDIKSIVMGNILTYAPTSASNLQAVRQLLAEVLRDFREADSARRKRTSSSLKHRMRKGKVGEQSRMIPVGV